MPPGLRSRLRCNQNTEPGKRPTTERPIISQDAGKDCKLLAHALHGKAYDIDKGQRNVKYHVDQQHLTRLVEDDRLGCIYKREAKSGGDHRNINS